MRVYRVRTALTHPAADAPGSPLSRNAGKGAECRQREVGEGSAPRVYGPLTLAERQAPRTISIGPAPSGGRGDMRQTRRLAAILAAETTVQQTLR